MKSGLNSKPFKSKESKALSTQRHPWGQPCNGRWCPESKLAGRPPWGGRAVGGGALSQWLITEPQGTWQEPFKQKLIHMEEEDMRLLLQPSFLQGVSGKKSIISGRRFKLPFINLCGFTVKPVGLRGEPFVTLHSRCLFSLLSVDLSLLLPKTSWKQVRHDFWSVMLPLECWYRNTHSMSVSYHKGKPHMLPRSQGWRGSNDGFTIRISQQWYHPLSLYLPV